MYTQVILPIWRISLIGWLVMVRSYWTTWCTWSIHRSWIPIFITVVRAICKGNLTSYRIHSSHTAPSWKFNNKPLSGLSNHFNFGVDTTPPFTPLLLIFHSMIYVWNKAFSWNNHKRTNPARILQVCITYLFHNFSLKITKNPSSEVHKIGSKEILNPIYANNKVKAINERKVTNNDVTAIHSKTPQ